MKTDKEFLSDIYSKAKHYKQNPPEWFEQEEEKRQTLLTSPKIKQISTYVSTAAAVVLIVGAVTFLQGNLDNNNINSSKEFGLRLANEMNEQEMYNDSDIVVIVEYNSDTKKNEIIEVLKNQDNLTGWETALQEIEIESKSIVFLSQNKDDFDVDSVSAVLADENENLYYMDEENSIAYIYG